MSNKQDAMIILRIDTSERFLVKVSLVINKKEYLLEESIARFKTQRVLPLLVSLLSKQSLVISDIEAIEVNTGPGSYTGLRVGVSIANTLSTVLKIPINGKKSGEIVEPRYV